MTTEPVAPPAGEDAPAGFAYAITAYLLWGSLPLYLKHLSHIPALEVVAHRAIWSVPIAAVVVAFKPSHSGLLLLLREPRNLLIALLTAALIAVNSLTYVYAIMSDRLLQSALGYYINPLIPIVLAALFLHERITGLKLVAVGFAAAAVLVLTFDTGGLPWISMVIAVSWGFYAFFKKSLPIGANEGFLLEMMIVSVPALIYVIVLEGRGDGHLIHGGSWTDTFLLMVSGATAAAPLMIFANGAKLLRLSTLAIMQYVSPTIGFLLAVFVFHEPFEKAKLFAFLLIWVAVGLYAAAIVADSRRTRSLHRQAGEDAGTLGT